MEVTPTSSRGFKLYWVCLTLVGPSVDDELWTWEKKCDKKPWSPQLKAIDSTNIRFWLKCFHNPPKNPFIQLIIAL